MIIRKRLDDPESRRFWESVEEGARRYAALPDWKKGELAPRPAEYELPGETTLVSRKETGHGD